MKVKQLLPKNVSPCPEQALKNNTECQMECKCSLRARSLRQPAEAMNGSWTCSLEHLRATTHILEAAQTVWA